MNEATKQFWAAEKRDFVDAWTAGQWEYVTLAIIAYGCTIACPILFTAAIVMMAA